MTLKKLTVLSKLAVNGENVIKKRKYFVEFHYNKRKWSKWYKYLSKSKLIYLFFRPNAKDFNASYAPAEFLSVTQRFVALYGW